MSCTLRARWEKRPCMAAIPWRVGVFRWRPPHVFARCNAPLARSAPLLFCRTAVILSSRGGFAFHAHLLPMCLTSPAPPTVEGAGPRSLPPQGIRACSFFCAPPLAAASWARKKRRFPDAEKVVSFFSCFLRNSPLASRLVPPESLANPRFSRFLPSHPALSRVSQLSCLFTLVCIGQAG